MLKAAFISDIHFGELARSNEFTLPGQIAKGETARSASLSDGLSKILKEKNVKYLFVGGDLTSRAQPQEFFYCEKKILSIACKADIPEKNIIWGIGNHDVDWNISKIFDQYKAEPEEISGIAKNSYRIIASSVASHNLQMHPNWTENGPVPLSGIIETEDFVAFILNSAIYCTHDQEFSHGKLSDEQIEWFEKKANEYKTKNKWKIALMHHHPHNYSYHISSVDISTLEEGSKFTDIAGSAGIDLVLHGHRHHPRAETVQKTHWNKGVTFICGGSLSVNAEHRSNGDIPNTFHIISLSDEPGILKLENFEYSASEGWTPLKNNKPETPLDAEMKLGKIILEDQAREIVLKMGDYSGTTRILSWSDYEDTLHYWGATKTNQLIEELLSQSNNISGKFPNRVFLERVEDIHDTKS